MHTPKLVLIWLETLIRKNNWFFFSLKKIVGEGGIFWEISIETSILSRVKQITSPGWMHEISAQGWCTGKTKKDRMGREGVSGWGTHVNPWLIRVNVWQNPLQYSKVISLQLIKINEKMIDMLQF